MIGIGSNLGERKKEITEAIDFLSSFGPLRVAPWYVSPPYGFDSEKEFINTAVILETSRAPYELLRKILDYEKERGRDRKGTFADRPIDLDILLADELVVDHQDLRIPHPEMHKRAFVIRPAADLSPAWIHPILKKDLKSLLMECPDAATLAPYAS